MSAGQNAGRGPIRLPEPIVGKIEAAAVLDLPGKLVGKAVRGALAPGAVKDALSGTWLGHAVHPLLTDVVIGSFTSASLLDLIGGRRSRHASERLIVVGIIAYAPTALTGFSDWADSEAVDASVRRAGLVHAISNSLALTLYSASLAARRRGARGRGVLLGGVGASVLMGAAYLGGHLLLVKGVGADQTAFDPGPEDWSAAVDAGQLAQGAPARVVVNDTPVLVLRDGARLFAIHDRCSHRGCSLSDGELEGEEIVCACHGSRFDLNDGSVRAGPATVPQPAFEARERGGRIEIRRR